MTRSLLEFFWMPSETLGWLDEVIVDLGLWGAYRGAGRDVRLLDLKELTLKSFAGLNEDGLEIFLGSSEVSHPVWDNKYGKHLIDFKNSYAVQFVPSVIAPDGKTLLQGRMAILRLDQYDDADKAGKLYALFHRLQSSMKQKSDRERVIVQTTTNGTEKTWRSMLVGKEVPGPGITQLKQFVAGPVVFGVKSR